jgi:hypothetical protein
MNFVLFTRRGNTNHAACSTVGNSAEDDGERSTCIATTPQRVRGLYAAVVDAAQAVVRYNQQLANIEFKLTSSNCCACQ